MAVVAIRVAGHPFLYSAIMSLDMRCPCRDTLSSTEMRCRLTFLRDHGIHMIHIGRIRAVSIRAAYLLLDGVWISRCRHYTPRCCQFGGIVSRHRWCHNGPRSRQRSRTITEARCLSRKVLRYSLYLSHRAHTGSRTRMGTIEVQ